MKVTKTDIVNTILKRIIPDKIYVVGYTASQVSYSVYQGQEIPELPEDLTHLDLVILKSSDFNKTLYKRIEAALKIMVPATVMLMTVDHFRELLRKGIDFAVRPVQMGQLIFNANPDMEESVQSNEPLAWKAEAAKCALHMYVSANEFLAGAGRYESGKKELKHLALFFTRQAAILYLRSAIMFSLGLELKDDTTIKRLFQIARWAGSAFRNIFDLDNPGDIKILELFAYVYVESLYHHHFSLPQTDLIKVKKKVDQLRKAVIPLVNAPAAKMKPKMAFGPFGDLEKW